MIKRDKCSRSCKLFSPAYYYMPYTYSEQQFTVSSMILVHTFDIHLFNFSSSAYCSQHNPLLHIDLHENHGAKLLEHWNSLIIIFRTSEKNETNYDHYDLLCYTPLIIQQGCQGWLCNFWFSKFLISNELIFCNTFKWKKIQIKLDFFGDLTFLSKVMTLNYV